MRLSCLALAPVPSSAVVGSVAVIGAESFTTLLTAHGCSAIHTGRLLLLDCWLCSPGSMRKVFGGAHHGTRRQPLSSIRLSRRVMGCVLRNIASCRSRRTHLANTSYYQDHCSITAAYSTPGYGSRIQR